MWDLEIAPEVKKWLHQLRKDDRELLMSITTTLDVLRHEGPGLGRPRVDSLAGNHAKSRKLKELRLEGTIRIAFVYHDGKIIILLAHGDKRGISSKNFYDELIETAIKQYDSWLEGRKQEDDEQN